MDIGENTNRNFESGVDQFLQYGMLDQNQVA